MNPRTIIAYALFVIAFMFGWRYLMNWVYPARPAPPAPAHVEPEPPPATMPSGPPMSAAAASSAPGSQFSFIPGESRADVTLGGAGQALTLNLSPDGASVGSVQLTSRKQKGEFVYRASPTGNEPYTLLSPYEGSERIHRSFETHQVWISQLGTRPWRLDELTWKIAGQSASAVVFETELRDAAGAPLLRIRKTYELVSGKPIVLLTLSAENLSDRALDVRFEQDGPVGLTHVSEFRDVMHLMGAYRNSGGVSLGKVRSHSDLRSATQNGKTEPLIPAEATSFLWTGLVNKYFAAVTRALPQDSTDPAFIQTAEGLVVNPAGDDKSGDLVARLTTRVTTIAPQKSAQFPIEIYLGPKDREALEDVNPAFLSPLLNYLLLQSSDSSCCTFQPLPRIMAGLLHGIQYVVRNFGIAIFILVIIVRTLLHPLAVFQQKSMYRMQASMARLHPRIEAIKEKFPNDRVRQNQETMKVWAEEGINPAAQFTAFLPMFIQMPILVALWTALNTDIHLRHAPFDGWWIKDLSAPDGLVRFGEGGLTIPVLGWIVPTMFAHIPSLNLLPILMGVSMWLQQKYMPKPKFQRPASAPGKKSATGLTPEEQMRQQQIMSYMMCLLFPVMFYYMPSGLVLYWLATNVFGVFESLRIRRQIEAEQKQREALGPQAPKKKPPGMVSRIIARMAEQAEQIQRRADEATREKGRK